MNLSSGSAPPLGSYSAGAGAEAAGGVFGGAAPGGVGPAGRQHLTANEKYTYEFPSPSGRVPGSVAR